MSVEADAVCLLCVCAGRQAGDLRVRGGLQRVDRVAPPGTRHLHPLPASQSRVVDQAHVIRDRVKYPG